MAFLDLAGLTRFKGKMDEVIKQNNIYYAECSTAADVAAKTASLTGYALVSGLTVAVKFTYTNTASSPTLNINSTGDKAVYLNGAAFKDLQAGHTYMFRYNGTQYDILGSDSSVLEYADEQSLPGSGRTGVVYITTDTNVIYRWDSTLSEYVPISNSDTSSVVKVDFSIATTDWTLSNGKYVASVTNLSLVENSEELVIYDSSIEESLTSNIVSEKSVANHSIIFTTKTVPTGTVSGRILFFCSTGPVCSTVFYDKEFSIATTDWTNNSGTYTAQIASSRIDVNSGIWAMYDASYDQYASAAIISNPIDGGVVFTTSTIPSGIISGVIRSVGSINGTVPVNLGGTGATSLQGARELFGVDMFSVVDGKLCITYYEEVE